MSQSLQTHDRGHFSGLRDDTGEALLDEPTAKVLVALLGAAATILGLVLQRAGDIRHQVKNSHGTNLRDDIDKLDARIRGVEETAGHAVRAARRHPTTPSSCAKTYRPGGSKQGRSAPTCAASAKTSVA